MTQTQELLDQAKADGVTVALAEGLKLKAAGPETAVAKWRPRLAEQRGWIIAALKPDDPTPDHRCDICRRPARFGFEVNVLQGKEGRWACLMHRTQVEASTTRS
jgi:hypothetical protein